MIIGITGTNGAGKGTVVSHLVAKDFKHYSAREFISIEIRKRGLPLDRSSMQEVGNDLRRLHGPAYVVQALYEQAVAAGGNAVIESVRVVAEAQCLKKSGAALLAVDADRALRYERTVSRGSETDRVDFDTWVAQEEREWHNAAAGDMDVPAVVAMADYTVTNNGSLDELHAQVDKVLEEIKK